MTHVHTPTMLAFKPDNMTRSISELCWCGHVIKPPPLRVTTTGPDLKEIRRRRSQYLRTMRRKGHL